MLRKLLAALLVAAALLVMGYVAAHDYVEAAAFVVRAAGMQGLARKAAAVEAVPVTRSEHPVPWRSGTLRGRTYEPASITGRPILLVPGIHAAGIDEPRLINFATEIAAAGHPVITAGLPPLNEYRLSPATTDMIEDAALWVRGEWAPRIPGADDDVGLMGISFGGGLAVVAASRLADRAAWVLSLGGHGDLARTLRYLAGGSRAAGTVPAPHDYGVVIILLNAAGRVVPEEQVEPLRRGLHTFLEASHLDMVDKTRAAEVFGRARAMAAELPEPARTYMTWVNDRNVGELGALLRPQIDALGDDTAMSPEDNPPPSAPVYLLHGSGDNVIPASETERLAEDLARRGGEVIHLVTPLITHAEVDRPPSPTEIWRLVRFWAAPL